MKGGDLRLVLDMRVPNQALERRRVQFPTVDDILHKMEGSTIFTEVDLSQGYLHISLAKESRQAKERNPARQEESRSSGQRTSSQNISRSMLVP